MATRKRPTQRMVANIGIWEGVVITNLKLWLTGLFAGVVAVLYAMLRYQSHKTDKANERANDEHERADKYRDANIENQMAIEKAKDGETNAQDIARMSSDDKRDRLRKYARDRDSL